MQHRPLAHGALRSSLLRGRPDALRRGAVLLAATAFLACSPSKPSEAPAPTPPPAEEEPLEDAQPAPGAEGPAADVLYAQPEALPPAPSECDSLSLELPVRSGCEGVFEQVATALAAPEVDRDPALYELEACDDLPLGYIRALRAEAQPLCADLLVAPLVGEELEEVTVQQPLRATLVGLGLAARLRRSVQTPPSAPASATKADLEAYFSGKLFPWASTQATAIYALAAQGAALPGYARGLVAVEAGMADMRFVEMARGIPVPPEIADSEEVSDVYYAALDEALGPRKARGRDAALVGLAALARTGTLNSERVELARTLLSRVYGGRRINALDTLLVPPPPSLESAARGAEGRLLSALPSPYVGIAGEELSGSSEELSAALQHGLPPALDLALRDTKDAELKVLLAYGHLRKGQIYFDAADFRVAFELLGGDGDAVLDSLGAEARARAAFYRALCLALMAGPKNAFELFSRGPRFGEAVSNLHLLEAQKLEGGYRGEAGFDMAYLQELAAPPGAPEHWESVAHDYDEASRLLTGGR